MGPARSLMRGPLAQTEGDQGPSSELGNKKWPEDTAEDGFVLGRPRPLRIEVEHE